MANPRAPSSQWHILLCRAAIPGRHDEEAARIAALQKHQTGHSRACGVDLSTVSAYITQVHLRLPALLLFFIGFSAMAQQTPVIPPTVPTAGRSDEMVKLQFPNSDVKDVLAFYERLTGKRIVADNNVLGPVNIVVNTQVPRSEAIRIIEINLLLNGFSLIPEDNDIVKVVGISKNPRTAAVPIFSDLDQLPEGERVVTFLFKLQFADPAELTQTLYGGQYIAQSTYTNFVALPKAQALLVTESTGVIRTLAKVIHEIDVPPAEVQSEFIKLERADAKDVIEKLEKIFEKQQTATGVPGAAPAIRQTTTTTEVQPPPNAAPPSAPSVTIDNSTSGLSEESIVIGKIRLTADIRTNRIHVITRPINLPFVRRLIHEFDSDVPFGEPAKRTLKFVSASDVLDIVKQAITEPGTNPSDAAGAAGANPATRQNANTQRGAGSNASSFGGSNASSGGGFNVNEELSTEPRDTTPQAVTVGNTKIIADPRENTIIVIGNKEVQQRVFNLLDQIDVRAPQVMLNTVIGELSLNDDQEFGIDYLLHSPASNLLNTTGGNTTGGTGTGAGTGTGTTTTSVSNIFAQQNGNILAGTQGTSLGTAAAAAAGIASGGGFNALVGATNSLDVIVHALDSTGRFRITNRPMVFTSNNKKAVIASGQRIAIPTQTLSNLVNNTTVNNTAAVSSSIQYEDVVLQLEVVPLINSDREVSLDILQKLDSIVPGADRNVGGTNVPTISRRYIKSNLSVANRSTVVLGGLITRTGGSTITGIPLVSRIPVLGYLFKNTAKKNDRAELIVLIRPVVSNTPFESVENSRVEQNRLLIEPSLDATIDSTAPRAKAASKSVNFRYEDESK